MVMAVDGTTGARSAAWTSELAGTLALSWPLVATNLGQIALSATAVVMMGRLGPDALAGGALAAAFYNALMIFCVGLISATSPIMAAELGRNPNAVDEVRRTVRQGFWSAIAIFVPVWLVLSHTEELLLLAGQEPRIAALAGEFMAPLKWALLPHLGYTVLRSFLAAVERPLLTVAVSAVAIVLNIVMAPRLMGTEEAPGLGLAGAGLSIALSSCVMLIGAALIVTFDPRFRRFRLFSRLWTPDWRRFLRIWRIGLPTAIFFAFEVTVFDAAYVLMGLISTTALAAHAIALQITAITYMIPLGFSQAATVRIGRAWGAGDRAAAGRAGWTAFTLGLVVTGTTGVIAVTAPEYLIGFFIDTAAPQNADVVRLAAQFLGLAAIFQVFDGAQVVGAGMLRGLQDTSIPMLIAGVGYWVVGLPLGIALAFSAGLGGLGIWIGLAAALGVVAAMMMVRWVMREPWGLLEPKLSHV